VNGDVVFARSRARLALAFAWYFSYSAIPAPMSAKRSGVRRLDVATSRAWDTN
jgi:hypothetical protein